MTDTTTSTPTATIQRVPADTSPAEIKSIVERDGGVILSNFFTVDQVRRFNDEIDPFMTDLEAGSPDKVDLFEGFHGANTKRLTNVVTHSSTFREEMIQDPRILAISDEFLLPVADSYQMTAAQVIEIGPGNKPQPLHRDLENWPIFRDLGPSGYNVTINFLTALSDFTEDNGATRVIPGSSHWDDYEDRGTPENTIPALLNKGDVLLIDGKVAHGGGENKTTDNYRRAMAWSFTIGWLTSEEAHAFLVPLDLVKTLPPKIQNILGFRSFHNASKQGGTLWQANYDDIAKYLEL
ncbi:phytanoyl-CoA dioxygenase family protein [Nocardia sp. NBC_00565]|uniref:phytanoyl-CoA dioxygenase family protein n=1 Tax=Nocardia sp. NBC_00565 TaxID=2975993 RepID=UPI002E80DF65|nr:phytanoyl-CoA dioxygenase family protein [Nocardia sp. NBC_00565]WUC06361.1 phytanoyl-CoA dioxygenase family protein [Nocardia sp. NBC_00565]